MPRYAELHCLSNFTFLRGASHPEELVEQAHKQGYSAIAITDECSLTGVVRAHEQASKLDIKLIIGSELQLEDGPKLVLLAKDRTGYSQLCRLITHARRNASKGHYRVYRSALEGTLQNCLALLLPKISEPPEVLHWFGQHFEERGWIALELVRDGYDAQRLQAAQRWQKLSGRPLLATGDVHMHRRGRRALQDLVTAIRLTTPIADLGYARMPNGERHLRSLKELAHLYPAELLEESGRVADLCHFSLNEVRYQYPDDVTPKNSTPPAYLRQLTEQGLKKRWPKGYPQKVRDQVEHELRLIAELKYESYFLTVWDIVRFARQQNILCQGRGSAANSAVCYCLGITEVDPSRMNLLFERFISKERDEPPDIDVDFEHERREEVIQYIYQKYGRHRTALTATVITYRSKSVLRDAGKALGLPLEQIESLISCISGWRSWGDIKAEYIREAGFDPDNPVIKKLLILCTELKGFPRHLSQHVGGFVITQGRLDDLVPIENASMPDRTVIQWEKSDLETLGLLKVDILALGMLSAIRRAFQMIQSFRGQQWSLATLPKEDPEVYHMIQKADTVGVFQIESRAQMSMLPRLRPNNYYDLVIEVAIVRPGPIQGDMVHPYLRRRQGKEPVSYPSDAVRDVLSRTLGIPIFQEQVIKLAMVAAGFTPGEADQLRRAMAAWKRRGGLEPYRIKLMNGMQQRGYSSDFFERLYKQILGFGEYGFPESHAASFALLTYVSSWLKCHEPAIFCAALINSQPMGFYRPAQLVRDAQDHGVEVAPVDINRSDWDCTLESGKDQHPILRLGLRLVSGLSHKGAQQLIERRAQTPFSSVEALAQRSQISQGDIKALAAADALASIAGHRHQASWDAAGIEQALPLLANTGFTEQQPDLLSPSDGQAVLSDYNHLGLTLRQHPLGLLRQALEQRRLLSAQQVADSTTGQIIRAAGLTLSRQRPGNGKAVFVTLEDETGNLNLVIWADLAERQRNILINAKLLGVVAEIQRADGVQHLMCRQLEDHSDLLGDLQFKSRNFH